MKIKHTSRLAIGAVLAAVLVSAACSDSTAGRVSLAFSTRPAPGASPAAPASGFGFGASVVAAGDTTVVALDGDTLIIRSVEIVVRDVELKRVEANDCPDRAPDDDGCEEFQSGALLVPLPLGTATEVAVTIAAPAARYDRLDFDIHKPDEIEDAAFIRAHPDFARISMRVRGTFSDNGTRTDFTFTSDLNEEQRIPLFPFLEVREGEPVTVTLRLDVSVWFVDGFRTGLVNPASANKGGANENLVRDNIRSSIDAFRDDNRDGLDDDNERG